MVAQRWRFLDPARPEEASRRARALEAIDRFWQGFAARRGEIAAVGGARQAQEPGWMEELLRPIDERLAWEVSPTREGGSCLAITPEGRSHLRPLVAVILDRAPELPGWTFAAYRPPVPAEDAAGLVQSRVDADLGGWTAAVSAGEHHRVDLTYFAPGGVGPGTDRAREIALAASECLLGEELLEEWVGGIRVVASGWRRRGAPPAELAAAVSAEIARIRARLPGEPQRSLAADLSTWKLFELAPRPADDHPEQRDVKVAKSALPAMWRAAHGPGRFSSRRFSRLGETFCYAKLDLSGVPETERFAHKSAAEDALMDALDQGGAGAFVGGGLGTRYAYVDLALADLDRGVDIARGALARLPAARRSWIQFFDAALAAEWVGVHAGAPPPPMPPELD